VPEDLGPEHAIGVAGTITTLATHDLELDEEDPALVHGHRMLRDRLEGIVEQLAVLPVVELRETRGIHPDRAPVIVAGGVVVVEVLRHFGLEQLEVSERDILYGAALTAAELPAPTEGDAPPGAYVCC